MLNTLLKLENPIVVCHSHADVDAVCSGLIIANKLNCSLYVPDYITHHAQRTIDKIIPKNAHRIVTGNKNEIKGDIIIVDANNPKMTGIGECKVLIDHHPNPTIKAEYYFVNQHASSTCEILSQNLKLEGWEKIAAAAGIIDDTNVMRFISQHTLQNLMMLVSAEQYNQLIYLLTQHYSSVGEKINVIKSLNDAKIDVVNNKILLITKSNSFDPNIADRLMDFGEAIIMYKETETQISIMLRTKDIHIHCGELAQSYDQYGCTGGGHEHAASIKCPLLSEDVLKDVIRKIRSAMKKN